MSLDEAQQRKFDRIAAGEPYQGVQAMNLTSYEKGVLKGKAEGKAEGVEEGSRSAARRILVKQLERKFGPIPVSVMDRIRDLTLDEIDELVATIPDKESLEAMGLHGTDSE